MTVSLKSHLEPLKGIIIPHALEEVRKIGTERKNNSPKDSQNQNSPPGNLASEPACFKQGFFVKTGVQHMRDTRPLTL